MYKLGIIGGMGPEATELLYRKIIENTEAARDQEHIDAIILNHASMPDRTEAILSGNTGKVISMLKADVELLNGAGVKVIGIPCNTSHCFLDSIRPYAKGEIVDMIDETVAEFCKSGKRKAGIMCTDGTLKAGMYKRACEKHGVELIYPDEETQKTVMNIIYGQVKKGELGSKTDFLRAAEYFKNSGCDGILVSCTELSCVLMNHGITDGYFVDALGVLANRCIEKSGYKIRWGD